MKRSRNTVSQTDGSDPLGYPRHLIWELFSIGNFLSDIQKTLAKGIGVSGAQWLILSAIELLDQGDGARVTEVSDKLHVNSTSVTTQAKQLEAMGMVRREAFALDGRVVLLKLTDAAKNKIAAISATRREINNLSFGGMSQQQLSSFLDQSAALRAQLENAAATAKLKKNWPSQ